MKIFQYLSTVKLDPNTINIPTLSATQIVSNVLNTVYFVSGIVAVIVIILAGYKYTTSIGDSGAITKAKTSILHAVIGLVVIALAFVITWFVIGRF